MVANSARRMSRFAIGFRVLVRWLMTEVSTVAAAGGFLLTASESSV